MSVFSEHEEVRIGMTNNRSASALEDIKIHVRLKLCALWTSLMFLYIYADYTELYQPRKLQAMLAGRMALGAVSQGVLMGMAVVVIIPSLMPFASLVLPRGVNRWLNIVVGSIYTVIMILVIRGGWQFYVLFGLIEIVLTMLIVWHAWTWPRQNRF